MRDKLVFITCVLAVYLLLLLGLVEAAPLEFNPMQCQTNKTELKRIEMQLTRKIFELWDSQVKIATHTDYVVENVWEQANKAARRIVADNFKCKRV
jgi:hypothetical protein